MNAEYSFNQILKSFQERLNQVSNLQLTNKKYEVPINNYIGDVTAIINQSNRKYNFVFEIKKQVIPSNIEGILSHTQNLLFNLQAEYMLLATYISAGAKEALFKKDLNYYDLSGNMFLKFSDVYIYIDTPKSSFNLIERSSKKLKPKEVKVVKRIIDNPSSLNLSYRDLEKEIGVSRGTIMNTLKLLRSLGLIEIQGSKRKIIDMKKLKSRYELDDEALKLREIKKHKEI